MSRPPFVRAAALVLAVAGGSSSCSVPGTVTGAALEDSLATTYAHLYVRQQALQQHPVVTVADLDATAECDRGDQATPDEGPGTDWQCVVTFLVDGAGTPATALYHLEVRTDGSYVADGEGPRQVNELRTLPVESPGGGVSAAEVLNPLWQLEGAVRR